MDAESTRHPLRLFLATLLADTLIFYGRPVIVVTALLT